VDENPMPVISGTLGSVTADNRVMFGSGASAGTQDIYFDWVRYCVTGDLAPGQGDGDGAVPVSVALPPCVDGGVDRCTISASGIPFYRYSENENEVRFSIQDLEGNTGWSPSYTVRVVLLDTDGDRMDDNWERQQFGNLYRNGTADFDNDGQSDYSEFSAGTNPTNPLSRFEILDAALLSANNLALRWTAATGKRYIVHSRSSPMDGMWSNASATLVTASSNTASWTGPRHSTPQFYRIQVVP
jgi:hypothetical protein